MQGKRIPTTNTFTSEGFSPVPPYQDAQNNIHNHMMATKGCFAQLDTKAGVKEYGQAAVAAILQEVKQLEGKNTFMARAIHDGTAASATIHYASNEKTKRNH